MSAEDRSEDPPVGASFEPLSKVYRQFFTSSSEGSVILDQKTGQIDAINPALCQLLGLSEQNVIHEIFWDVYPFLPLKENVETLLRDGNQDHFRMKKLLIPVDGGMKMEGDLEGQVIDPSSGKIACIFHIRPATYIGNPVDALNGELPTEKENWKDLSELDLKDMELSHILDRPALQSLMEKFSATTNMVTAIVDLKGNVLVSTGWQDICVRFHRVHPETARNCQRSDLFLSQNVQPGEYVQYKCQNQLWDIVTPLLVGGVHLGNIYSGQFFYDDEEVDLARFEEMAQKYGFNREKYLAAVQRIPRFSHDQIQNLMDFLTQFSQFVSRLSLTNFELIKANAQQAKTEATLREQETRLRNLIRKSPIAMALSDPKGKITFINEKHRKTFGYELEEIQTITDWFRLAYPDPAYRAEAERRWMEAVGRAGEDLPEINSGEYFIQTKDGSQKVVEISGSQIGNQLLVVFNDITDRKIYEQRIQTQLEHLSALKEIDKAITTSFDLRISLGTLVQQVCKQLQVDAADVLIYNEPFQTLSPIASRGFHSRAIEKARFYVGDSLPGRAIQEQRFLHLTAAELENRHDPKLSFIAEEKFVSYFCVPLIVKGQTKGVLEVYHRTPFDPEDEWLDFLKALAEQAAIAIDNATLFESLQKSNLDLSLAYDATIEGWSRALDMRDKETEGHTQRVTDITVRLARLFGIEDDDLTQIRWGALLHDIGKMGISDQVLLKPGPLTREEWELMRQHPVFAYQMLSPIRYLRSALDIPYCHHEKWDGSGYPQGLSREQIPLAARIFAIVDVWDALRTDRPYRAAWPEKKVLEYIQSMSGKQFDPDVLKVIFQSGLLREEEDA